MENDGSPADMLKVEALYEMTTGDVDKAQVMATLALVEQVKAVRFAIGSLREPVL